MQTPPRSRAELPEKRKRSKADIRNAALEWCRDREAVSWSAAGYCPATEGLFVIGGMSELFRCGFTSAIQEREATGRFLISIFVSRINDALSAGCRHVVLSFDCAPPREKYMEQISRTVKMDAPPLEWNGTDPLLVLDQLLPPWDSLMANRKARFRMIEELMMHLSQPHGRERLELHDPETCVWLDYHKALVELRAGSYCVFHPSTNMTEDDFALFYWMNRLEGHIDGPCVCLNSDTDCITACFLYDRPLINSAHDVIMIGAIDNASRGTDFILHKHINCTLLRQELLHAFPGRTAAEIGIAMVCGGGDYISAPPQCSYKNLLLALADMDPATTPLCDVDEEGVVKQVHSRSLELLLCTALCKRVNAACKRGCAVSVATNAPDPMRVLLDDLRAYGRKSYLHAITILWSEYPRHFANTWWYVDYVTASILNVRQPSGEGRGWIEDQDGHLVYPPIDRKVPGGCDVVSVSKRQRR